MLDIYNNIIKEDIKYGIKMKYKDFAKMFHLEHKDGGSRALQIRQLKDSMILTSIIRYIL